MEEDDEEHGCAHQLASKAADVGQFYVFYSEMHRYWEFRSLGVWEFRSLGVWTYALLFGIL